MGASVQKIDRGLRLRPPLRIQNTLRFQLSDDHYTPWHKTRTEFRKQKSELKSLPTGRDTAEPDVVDPAVIPVVAVGDGEERGAVVPGTTLVYFVPGIGWIMSRTRPFPDVPRHILQAQRRITLW